MGLFGITENPVFVGCWINWIHDQVHASQRVFVRGSFSKGCAQVLNGLTRILGEDSDVHLLPVQLIHSLQLFSFLSNHFEFYIKIKP